MTFQQICKDVHMVKTSGQQVFIESRSRPPPKKLSATGEYSTNTQVNTPQAQILEE